MSRARAAIVVVVAGVAVAVGVPAAWQVTRPAASAGTPPTAARPARAPAVGPDVPPVAARPAVPATRRADPPVRIRIPALGVDAAVEPVGVTSRGLMVIPERVDRVGWYRFGPAPGARSGSVVLAGHVDSARQGRGALFGLRSLGVGERIDLVTAGGRTASYRVTGRETIVKRQLPAERLFDRSGAPRLVLVTCGGPFDEATSSYRDNLVVAADPVTS